MHFYLKFDNKCNFNIVLINKIFQKFIITDQ